MNKAIMLWPSFNMDYIMKFIGSWFCNSVWLGSNQKGKKKEQAQSSWVCKPASFNHNHFSKVL